MPTPRQHGGAELVYIPLMVPGFKGLNKQQASATLGPEWATDLLNAVIDDSGRLAARKGWNVVTSSAAAAAFVQTVEFVKSSGATELIASTATALYKSTDNGATWTSVTGSVSFTNGNWQFFNFNDCLYGVQSGHAPIRYTGSGNFADVADVNAPTGGVGLAAFGRLWIVDSDGHSVQYSALLDGTDWTSSDSGVIDLWNIWPDNDHVTAMAAFNGSFVVFGYNTVVTYVDGQGSTLGIDPLQMYVVDVVKGTGCIARDSVQEVDNDLWFLSDTGIQTFGRVVRERSNPLDNLTKNVQDWLSAYVEDADLTKLRSAYSPRDKIFLLSLSSGGSTESGVCIAFDTRGKLDDGTARCLGRWTLVPTAIVRRRDGTLLMARIGNTGKLGEYDGALDDTASYVYEYTSGWLDLTQQGYLLIPKRYEGVFFADNNIDITFKWAFDFETEFHTRTKTFEGSSSGAEWGIGEWGLGEFGGGVSLRRGHVPSAGTGQYIKLGLSTEIDNTTLAIQKLTLFTKIGRLT